MENVINVSVSLSDVVGSEGEIQVATPEVLESLKKKGIRITKYDSPSKKSGRTSPTSAAVASISEDNKAVSALINENVKAGGVNIPLSELLGEDSYAAGADTEYVTQYVKEKFTGDIMQLRIPQSPARSKSKPAARSNNGSAGT